jgi:hypothetical protein
MHRNGEVLNNCKCLWIQVGAELAAVQLLFLGSRTGSSSGEVYVKTDSLFMRVTLSIGLEPLHDIAVEAKMNGGFPWHR